VPVQDQLELIKPNGEIEFHTLHSTKGITYIGSNPKNDIVLNDPHIRPFHAFLDHRQKPARLTFLENETGLLSTIPPTFLAHLDRVEFEGYTLVFLEGEVAIAPPQDLDPVLEPPKPASLLTIPFPDQGDEIIKVQLSVRALTVAVEAAAAVYITVTNDGDVTADFKVEVVGLAESWLTPPASLVSLQPAESQMAPLMIKPPRLPSSRAGIHHFAIKVTSPLYPERYCQQRATLTIQPYDDFALTELTPKYQTISWTKPTAQFSFSITNNGNTLGRFKVAGSESGCIFEFQAPGEAARLSRQIEFTLLPNETTSIPIQAAPISRLLLGLSRHTYHFIITTTLLQGGHPSRSVLGHLTQKPLVGPGILSLMVVILAALASLVLIHQPSGEGLEMAQTRPGFAETPEPLIFSFPRPSSPAEPPSSQDNGNKSYEQMFEEIAIKYNLDRHVLEALAYQESQMNHLAVGQASDMGLMQVIPATWNEWAPKVNVYDPFDPYSNILVGAAYLAHIRDFCLARGRSEPHWMLLGYNWGPYRLDQFFERGGTWEQIPPEQRQYISTILKTATARALSSTSFEDFYKAPSIR